MSQLKAVMVKMAGRGNEEAEAERVLINPGTKVSDVLKQMNLPEGYRLSFNGSFLDPSADLYSLVKEGDQLVASSDPQVGR